MNYFIKRMLAARDRARKKHLRTKDPADYEFFSVLRNKVKQEIHNANVRHPHDIFNNCKSTTRSKTIWGAIRSLGVDKKKISLDVMPVTADQLNKHYVGVSSVKDPERVSNTISQCDSERPLGHEAFFFQYVMPGDILKAVMSVTSEAKGVDLIPVRFLKLCLLVILPVTEHIFNFCLQSGVFPALWKRANILPIPKSNQPVDCKDFRPVSILCTLGKILEKAVHAQVCSNLNRHSILIECHSGFRKQHSTTTVLIAVGDDIRKAIDKSMSTVLVMLDFSKAFDCVHHDLLTKLYRILTYCGRMVQQLSY